MKSNTLTLLTVDAPTTSEDAIPWTMQLGMAGDSLGEGIEAVVKLGDVVQTGALLALASPPDGNPFGLLPVDPAAAEEWLVTSGEMADAASHAGGLAMITTGEAVPVLARLLSMECTPELAAKIQAKMG